MVSISCGNLYKHKYNVNIASDQLLGCTIPMNYSMTTATFLMMYDCCDYGVYIYIYVNKNTGPKIYSNEDLTNTRLLWHQRHVHTQNGMISHAWELYRKVIVKDLYNTITTKSRDLIQFKNHVNWLDEAPARNQVNPNNSLTNMVANICQLSSYICTSCVFSAGDLHFEHSCRYLYECACLQCKRVCMYDVYIYIYTYIYVCVCTHCIAAHYMCHNSYLILPNPSLK